MSRSENIVLVACIAIGAVAGFTFTGGAAIGTALGAGVGVAAGHVLRSRRAARP